MLIHSFFGLVTPLVAALSDHSHILAYNLQFQAPISAPPSPDYPAASDYDQPQQPSLSAPMMMTYYPGWAASYLPPEQIDFKRLHWIDFAFAIPAADFSLTWDSPTSPDLLSRLVVAAHSQGTNVKLSVGGWDGSIYFSSAVATNVSRQCFVDNLMATYKQFNLDGIDIDWEYPGYQGNAGNQVSPDDSSNFLLFLQLLRATLPSNARISTATLSIPFIDNRGKPMTDVSQFSSVLDWILIMNYDVWGASDNPGPNSPLFDACQNSNQPDSSALAAYTAWTSAGFPPSKIVLGVPAYGYVSHSTHTSLRNRNAVSSNITVTGEGSQALFRELVSEGALIPSSDRPGFAGASGFTRFWDECSCTPYLQSISAGQIISYDDPESLGMKAKFAKEVGMMGVNMFPLDGDTREGDLVTALRREMGLGDA